MLFRVADLENRMPSTGERYVVAFRKPHMRAVLYAPRGHDPQTPHKADEAYIVVTGSGKLWVEGELFPCGPGDLLYVPAGKKHRFVDFTDDLAVWVVFERASLLERVWKFAWGVVRTMLPF